MSRRLVFSLPRAAYVIDTRRRRPSVDSVAMAIAGGVLVVWFVIAVIRIAYPEIMQ